MDFKPYLFFLIVPLVVFYGDSYNKTKHSLRHTCMMFAGGLLWLMELAWSCEDWSDFGKSCRIWRKLQGHTELMGTGWICVNRCDRNIATSCWGWPDQSSQCSMLEKNLSPHIIYISLNQSSGMQRRCPCKIVSPGTCFDGMFAH